MSEKSKFQGRAWNYPLVPLVMVDVPRELYIEVFQYLVERGVPDIFCCDRGIWLCSSNADVIQDVKSLFSARVVPLCSSDTSATDDEASVGPRLQLAS